MSLDPITAAFDAGKLLIQRIWPDPQKQAEEIRKLEELKQRGNLAELEAHVQLMLGQMEVNKTEAQHKSVFVAGWRPATGWVCSISLALAFIPKAMALTLIWAWQSYLVLSSYSAAIEAMVPGTSIPPMPALPAYPDLGLGDVLGILGGMLGMGAMRSFDKGRGTQTDSIKTGVPRG